MAIYGPNAAGKSNLIDAMGELRRHVLQSHVGLGATDPIRRDPYRLDQDIRPTRLECTFTVDGAGTLDGDAADVYEYGFEYTETAFRREWLYRMVRNERLSTQTLFERETLGSDVRVKNGPQLHGENRMIAKLTRPNSLFLSAAAQNNHPQLIEIYRYFAERWVVVPRERTMDSAEAAERLSEFEYFDRLESLVKQADLGIYEIDVDEEEVTNDETQLANDARRNISMHGGPSSNLGGSNKPPVDSLRRGKRLYFVHSGVGGDVALLDYNMQSKGTRALITLLVPALEALAQGSLVVIDELDTSLHPDLARGFVSLFAEERSNARGAQLLFSTHDVTLLNSGLISRDEVWVTDKDSDGASRFTPLTDFRLRARDDVERAYRNGRLGGVPTDNELVIDAATLRLRQDDEPGEADQA